MQHEEGMFRSSDGLRLFEQRWRPDTDPRAVIVIVHGFAEHSARHTGTAESLTDQGYAVYAFDLRGHGKSEGTRAFVRSFDKYLSDLEKFLTSVAEREPRKPIFLLGHSMGGTIATLFTITRNPEIRGLILSGPFLKVPDSVSPFLLLFASFVSFILPKLPLVKKVNSSLISRDTEVVACYDKDPRIYHGKVFARQATEINGAIKNIQDQMEAISLPVLILHGTKDHIADIRGSKELYARARSSEKTLKLYEGFYHEVLNDPGKNQVLADMITWLDMRVEAM